VNGKVAITMLECCVWLPGRCYAATKLAWMISIVLQGLLSCLELFVMYHVAR